METNRHGKSAQLASAKPPFRVYGSPSQFRRDSADARRTRSQPVIDIDLISNGSKHRSVGLASRALHALRDSIPRYSPGDFLTCEYRVDVPAAMKVHSFEASVVWFTSGKGDEDIGVHFFERRLTRSLPDDYLKHPQRLGTVLPQTPVSYDGRIVQVRWAVRIRLFLDDNSQVTQDQPFHLGDAGPCQSGPDVSGSAELADENSDVD